MDVVFFRCAGLDVHKKSITACRIVPDPTGQEAEGIAELRTFGTMTRDLLVFNWLQVLGTTETPQIDQGVRHQFHPVVALLDVLETQQQPLEFVLPRKRPLDTLP
jgi:transposase